MFLFSFGSSSPSDRPPYGSEIGPFRGGLKGRCRRAPPAWIDFSFLRSFAASKIKRVSSKAAQMKVDCSEGADNHRESFSSSDLEGEPRMHKIPME